MRFIKRNLILGAAASLIIFWSRGLSSAAVNFAVSATAKPYTGATGRPDEIFSLIWGVPVDVSSATATNTYYILASYGNTDPFVLGSTIASITYYTGLDVTLPAGTWSFAVTAQNAATGVFARSGILTYNFLGTARCLGDGMVGRVDSTGGQLGFGQQWKFTYSIIQDAAVSMVIYSTATTFALNSKGFVFPATNTTPIKVMLDKVPRPGAGALCNNATNEEIWDLRDSSGTVLNNGFYFIHFLVTNPLLPGTTLYSTLVTVPVDVLRFTAFSTNGLSLGDSSAKINYQITGDATVRIVIANPGRRMVLDNNGDVQSLNLAGTAIDSSSTSVVQVITRNKKAGTYAETWNGTDTNGIAASSGIYSVGLSARDAYGNKALALSLDSGLLSGTIPVDRTASQSAADTVPPVITTVTVGSERINSSGSSIIKGSISTIAIGQNEAAGSGANEPIVTLADPLGLIVAGALSIVGDQITFTPSTVLTTTGTYSLTVTPKDAVGNVGVAKTYTFVLQGTLETTGAQDTFKRSVIPYPNPVKASPVSIDYKLDYQSTVDFDVFNILGELVYHKELSGIAAGSNTLTWNLDNTDGAAIGNGVYVFRLRVKNSVQTLESVKKLMVIR